MVVSWAAHPPYHPPPRGSLGVCVPAPRRPRRQRRAVPSRPRSRAPLHRGSGSPRLGGRGRLWCRCDRMHGDVARGPHPGGACLRGGVSAPALCYSYVYANMRQDLTKKTHVRRLEVRPSQWTAGVVSLYADQPPGLSFWPWICQIAALKQTRRCAERLSNSTNTYVVLLLVVACNSKVSPSKEVSLYIYVNKYVWRFLRFKESE